MYLDILLAQHLTSKARAEMLLEMDKMIRREIDDEDTIIDNWLTYGIPDGCESLDDILSLDLDVADCVEIYNFGVDLLNHYGRAVSSN